MWLAIYPALTLALWLLEHLGLRQLALPLRTLVLTAVLVPAMVYVLIPAVTSALRLKASNGRVVASGVAYETGSTARKGCESVQKAAEGAPVVESDP